MSSLDLFSLEKNLSVLVLWSLLEKLLVFSLDELEKVETGVSVTEDDELVPEDATQFLLEFRLAKSGLNLGGSNLAS